MTHAFICLHLCSVQYTNCEDSSWWKYFQFCLISSIWLYFNYCTLFCGSAVSIYSMFWYQVVFGVFATQSSMVWKYKANKIMCSVWVVCLLAGLLKMLWDRFEFTRGGPKLKPPNSLCYWQVGAHSSTLLKWATERQRNTYLLPAHLVPYGFLGWEVEGVHLWKLWSQMIVELPELGVTSVHIPLIVQDADVHLRTCRHMWWLWLSAQW